MKIFRGNESLIKIGKFTRRLNPFLLLPATSNRRKSAVF